ncbi:hypothetical protein MtrunA17_Chr1g0146371 [Medicago truncatula]|uniref:DUF295 family protein n=1 Tax=Medicago truncatula TaxID=3880 RepID=G7I268_MEDTR|nr:F-box protein At2g17036 [Medicago truncatula]AES58686.1 DUF295 family protein [Medicago truncatula]RHN76667.1 hypothetical protein MtrunA17_Chr1g0146371 [Medicago truncatula]
MEKNPIIVGSLNCTGEEPVVLKCGDENWKLIPGMSAYLGDIRVFKGQPYVVDKFLVESDGDLLLADVYDHEIDEDADDYDRARINVFKLNEKEKKWVKLANLGDRVFFLGLLCSFSASASDLCVPKGNLVIIMDNIFTRVQYKSSFLDLDDGQLLPLSNYPEYSELFCHLR